jgi:RNA polymerase sigma-70 factor, ECF subfamily
VPRHAHMADPRVSSGALTLAAEPDAALTGRALLGDADAWREIVRRYERPLFNLISRMVQDRTAAEDLAQDAFLKVFRSLHTFDARLRFPAWILKIAHNTAIDHLRRHRPALLPLDASGPDDEPPLAERLPDVHAASPEQAAERASLAAAVDAALDRLRPEFRAVILLRYHEELEYDEIARVLDVPLGTVKTFLHRGRRALARELAALGWAPTAESAGETRPPRGS